MPIVVRSHNYFFGEGSHMKAETVYIFTFGSDSESTRVAAGLFQKHGTRASHAAVVNFGGDGPHTVANLNKGDPPLTEGIGQKKNTNFKTAWNEVKNEPLPGAGAVEYQVGVYVVAHGMIPQLWDPSPEDMVAKMKSVMPDAVFRRIERISIVQCNAVAKDAKDLMIEFLELLKDNGCRPQVAAWDTLVTASPGDPAQNLRANPEAQAGRKFIKTDAGPWRAAKAERELHKTVFQLNAEGALVSGPPSVFRKPV